MTLLDSVGPAVSGGQLISDITNSTTAITISPSGIGDAQYPASGYVCIGGNEVVIPNDFSQPATRDALAGIFGQPKLEAMDPTKTYRQGSTIIQQGKPNEPRPGITWETLPDGTQRASNGMTRRGARDIPVRKPRIRTNIGAISRV